jgi:hypothetical protein
VYHDPDIRLPRTADLLPPVIGARLLDDVEAGDVRRVAARRIAGRDAPGLRVFPASSRSSIDHADLWADPVTGIPLAVAVHARDEPAGTAFVSEFREFSSETPGPDTTSFVAPAGADVSFDDVLDIADAADQFAPLVAPPTLAGLAKAPVADRAVGVYGSGLTEVIVVPLRDREARPLRQHLRGASGSKVVPEGTLVTVGPLGILLTGCKDDRSWLVAGTVTEQTLVTGAVELGAVSAVESR